MYVCAYTCICVHRDTYFHAKQHQNGIETRESNGIDGVRKKFASLI